MRRPRSPSFNKGTLQVEARGADGRRNADQQRGQQGYARNVGEDSRIQSHLVDSRNALRCQRDDESWRPLAE